MIRNKRILFLTGSHTLSGSEIANVNVAEMLKMNGAEVFYLVAPWSQETVGKYIQSKNLLAISFRYYSRVYAWKYLLQALIMIFTDAFNLFRVVRKYRITSIHISSEHYARIFILYFLLTGRELVYRMGDAPNTHRKIFLIFWKKILFRKVSTFVCVSGYIAGKLKELGCPEQKIRIIYSYPFRRTTANEKQVSPVDKPANITICYAGQISAHKGVGIAVDAAIRLCRERKDIEFLLAGDIQYNKAFYSTQIEKINEAGLEDRIKFPGYVEDIFGFFSNSDIHLCPSVFEDPMPNVVFEAKAAGIPTVGFPSGGIPELISHKEDGYLCRKKDVDSLIEGIDHFMDRNILSNAKDAVRNSLERLGINREKFEKQWIEVYGKKSETGPAAFIRPLA